MDFPIRGISILATLELVQTALQLAPIVQRSSIDMFSITVAVLIERRDRTEI